MLKPTNYSGTIVQGLLTSPGVALALDGRPTLLSMLEDGDTTYVMIDDGVNSARLLVKREDQEIVLVENNAEPTWFYPDACVTGLSAQAVEDAAAEGDICNTLENIDTADPSLRFIVCQNNRQQMLSLGQLEDLLGMTQLREDVASLLQWRDFIAALPQPTPTNSIVPGDIVTIKRGNVQHTVDVSELCCEG